VTPALRLLFIGLAALGAGVLGYYVYDRARAPAAEPATVTAPAASATAAGTEAGTAAGTAAAAAATERTVPEMRPVFTLKDVDGKPRSITEWDGKSLMVNFWATWCAPCRREIPLLNALHAEFAPQGVEVLGIAVDFVEDVAKYMKETPIGYSILVGEQDGLDAAAAFGVDSMAFPFTIFVDARGRILTIHMGEIHEPEARAILAVLARVNAGELQPPEAREAVKTALAALKPAVASVDSTAATSSAVAPAVTPPASESPAA
jgi:thiol-disulfide isomerase/thioredoxin